MSTEMLTLLTILATIIVAIHGWALAKLISMDSRIADLNRWIQERVTLDESRHLSNSEKLEAIDEELIRCRERLHRMEGSVVHREREIGQMLDRIEQKLKARS